MTSDTLSSEIIQKLSKLASDEGLTEEGVTEVWGEIPVGDMGDMSYLEASAQCILEVSNLIDTQHPGLSQNKSIAKKYRLMSRLLMIKSEQLEVLQ